MSGAPTAGALRAARRVMADHVGRPEAADEDEIHALWIAKVIDEETAALEILDLLRSIENDAGQVPTWLWDRIQLAVRKAEGGIS